MSNLLNDPEPGVVLDELDCLLPVAVGRDLAVVVLVPQQLSEPLSLATLQISLASREELLEIFIFFSLD